MIQIIEYLFGQYSDYETTDIVLEVVAVIFGFLSVWYSKQNKVLVFPTGMISTAIFVYLLYKWGLLGDMMINGYYFAMSVYGWYVWTRKVDASHFTPISRTDAREKKQSLFIFIATILFVFVVYYINDKWIFTYIADFVVEQLDGSKIVEDVKGIDKKTGKAITTALFNLKKKIIPR